jgi:tellurite resistance protein TerC
LTDHNNPLFTFADYWWFYAGFGALILALLTIDLLTSRKTLTMKASVRRAGIWVLLGLSFSAVPYFLALARYGSDAATQMAFEYLTGYLVEESLSIDNLFVFALLFRYFGVTGERQHRVLFYGILGAMVFRGIFIAAGTALIRFHWVVLAFGVLLIVSAVRMAFSGDQMVEPERNFVIRLIRRFIPITHGDHGDRFIVREGGAIRFTPLVVVLLSVESSDVLFAVDSVPAVFAITREPLIVYTSNVFAILGLRALFLILAGALDRFYLLKYGLSFVLAFVGLKMVVLDEWAGGRIPIGLSLSVIAAALAASVILSLLFPRAANTESAGHDSLPAERL